MPFPMRIQPIDSQIYKEPAIRNEAVKPPVLKSRLKRLFDRPLNSVLKISSAAEKQSTGEKDGAAPASTATTSLEFEPSSVCLDKMVQNFIEENNNEKQSSTVKCGRNRCNCFNGNSNDSSDDEFDFVGETPNSSFNDPFDTLKSLIPCESVVERNLLADTSKIVEKNKICKRKDDLRKIVTDGLIALGYNASVCKSKWDKSPSIPAGEYEYIDVILEGERLIIDVDFRSEFEIARSTSSYKAILQSLPYIFVGKTDRILQIVSIVSEAARQSLKKKGMHIAPWRKAEYIKSKWLSPHGRLTPPTPPAGGNEAVHEPVEEKAAQPERKFADPADAVAVAAASEQEEVEESSYGDLDLIFGENSTASLVSELEETKLPPSPVKVPGEEQKYPIPPVSMWQPPAINPKSLERGNKAVVTGLASLLKDKL